MTDRAPETAAAPEGKAGIVFAIEPADLLTPVGAFLRLREHLPGAARNGFLLESIEGGQARGRFSVIGLLPDLFWRCHGGRVEISGPGSGDVAAADASGPIASLRAVIAASRITLPAELPPMIGGVFGYLGYDMVRQMERLPDVPADDLALPEAVMLRPSLFAVFDNVRDELVLAVPVRCAAGEAPGQAEARARALLASARAVLSEGSGAAPGGAGAGVSPDALAEALAALASPRSNMERDGFLRAVRRIQDYIAAGDAFQVVPSQRFSAPFPLDPFALYRALRRINPSPFLFFLEFDGFSLAGSSPEVLVRLRDGIVTVRPLAGTRRRGADRAEDLALERDLLADPKERAEHLMLVDLGRNDVGRVAATGSVRVAESFVVERFSHVMHISSTVEGRLRPELDALDALVAGFPAGTLTGAPKIRAMEIIDEMEPTRRAAYAGCIGYFAPDGSMDTCIGLRMAVLKDGMMHVQAGAGVVADSDPDAEWEETRQKARALFRAAEAAIATCAPSAAGPGVAPAGAWRS
ncbi:anthranilate synthase component I [Rhizosaccharibacter radicis]|uniref:Anthranilate synthase component 1 n=1 Tax=Rhizosaccharibacter radicis TaxID=2782605 RepID=A0ABT1VV60_9PROT|nr:anthranilate synthase component I [Acetobacteraceae bacterium KSS12]